MTDSAGRKLQFTPAGTPRRGRAVFKIILLVLLGAVLATGWKAYGFWKYMRAPEPILQKDVMIDIPPGMNFNKIAEKMRMEKAISDRNAFILYARLHQLTTKMQAGEYTFRPGMSPLTMLDMITRGDVTTVKLAVPEGFDIFDIANRLAKLGPWKAEGFITTAQDLDIARKYIIPVGTVEGYLFPAVYNLKMSMSEAGIIDLMYKRGQSEITPERLSQAGNLKMHWHEIMTLASMIQKETSAVDEMPAIAGVFYNRLEKKMLLQCDPTAVYGVRNFKGPIKKTDLLRPSPYNTYLHFGLPPGPICNPGTAAIDAALNPEKHDFLYFVATGDGRHVFSKNLLEHNKNVLLYKKKLQEQRESE